MRKFAIETHDYSKQMQLMVAYGMDVSAKARNHVKRLQLGISYGMGAPAKSTDASDKGQTDE